jgi:hypothetical protein
VSDTITLIAGVLLTSVGLLALLPFVLRLGHRRRRAERLAINDRLLPALAAAGVIVPPAEGELHAEPSSEEPVGEPVETEAETLHAVADLLRPRTHLTAVTDAEEDGLLPDAALASVHDDMEELMAHLFSLRMTVSEITAEVFDLQDVLFGEEPDDASDGDVEVDGEPERAAEPAA